MRLIASLGLILAIFTTVLQPASAADGASPAPKILFALVHGHGPRYDATKGFREQDGIMEHVGYMKSIHDAGKIVLGGPFLDEAGGLMVLQAADLAEARRVAEADPTVRNGLLTVTVHPWMIVFDQAQ